MTITEVIYDELDQPYGYHYFLSSDDDFDTVDAIASDNSIKNITWQEAQLIRIFESSDANN